MSGYDDNDLPYKDNAHILQTPRTRMNVDSAPIGEAAEAPNNDSEEVYNPYLSHKQNASKPNKKPTRGDDFNRQEPTNKKRKEDNSNYRDRAAERRQNVNPDYEKSDQIIQNLQEGLDRELAYHQSKYLGGDVEHTHLVKGLDFVLLEKIRKETQEKDPNYRDITDDDLIELTMNIQKENDAEVSKPIDEKPEFASKFAESIYYSVFSKPTNQTPKVNDLFIPDRMSYQFEIKNTDFGSLIPSTNVRSKASLSKSSQYISNSQVHNNVVDKVVQLFGYIRLGNQGLKPNQASINNLSNTLFDDGIAYAQKRSKIKMLEKEGIQPVVSVSPPVDSANDDDSNSLDDMFGDD